MEKPQLVNFIAKVLEDSGFKVYKNFKTSQQVVDIYAILQTSMGDFGLVVACKNYDKDWEVGIDVLKEMEVIGKKLKASKVAVVTSSSFSSQARRYAQERKIKLIDRNNLVTLAKKYSNKKKETKPRLDRGANRLTDIDSDSFYSRDVSREYIDNMPTCLAAADVVVCRAGAITISEIQAQGKPAVFIPSPNVAENHQYHNAMALVNQKAGEIIEESNLTGELLTEKIDKIVSDKNKLAEYSANAKKMAILDANERIYKLINETYEKHKK